MHPLWKDVGDWFRTDPGVLTRLTELVAQGHICRLTEMAGVSRLQFRHDRVLEYHLSQAASGMLIGERDDNEAVADPFFTTFVGRAIARTELPSGVLERVRLQNPVSLIAAVPYLTTSPSTYADGVVQLARSWLSQSGNYPDSMRYYGLWVLARANSPRVLDVTEGTPKNQRMWEARLRNGDASAGALALSREFFPAVRFSWLESLIEEARMHHGNSLSEHLRVLLGSTSLSDQQRYGALCLAGYLGDPTMASDVGLAWENAGDKPAALLAALWAGLRCAGNRPTEVVGPMMPHILTLQHDELGRSESQLLSILRKLRSASRHGFGEPVLTYLVQLGTEREEFRRIVALIVEHIDHPVTIRYVVRLLGEAEHSAREAGGFSSWAISWRDSWTRRESGLSGCLSSDSIATLRSLWADEQSPEWLQDYAFAVWATHIDNLAELAVVKPGMRQYESAVWQRAVRGDRSVAGYVRDKLGMDYRWFHVIHHIWDNKFEMNMDAALGGIATSNSSNVDLRSNDRFELGELLRDIPADVAERLLAKHWTGLNRSGLFIQAALYHGTAKCLELAAESLTQHEQNVDTLKYIGSFFGFNTERLRDRLTDHHLGVLLPYLGQLDDVCIGEMLDYCHQFDHWEWAKCHLEPEMRRRVSMAKPEFGNVIPYIVRITRRWFPTDDELLEELDRLEQIQTRTRPGHLSHWWDAFVERGDPEERASRLLFAWLAQIPSPSRFTAAAGLIRDRGKRQDLELLLMLNPAGEDPEAERAAADAEFGVRRRSLD